jgi:hypothetical protein
MYAVNIADLVTHRDNVLVQLMVLPAIAERQIADCEPGRVDGGAAILQREDDAAALIVKLVRKQVSKNLLRFYTKTKNVKTWTRV